MQINVPIYVNQRGDRSGPPVVARPLFFPRPEKSGKELGRVIASLTDLLRTKLTEISQSNSHEELLCWHETRPISHKTVKLQLDLGDSTARLKLLLVTVERFNQRMAFSPSLPSIWFDVLPGEDLQDRALEVYQSHFREIRKDIPSFPVVSSGVAGKAWVDYLTIDVKPGSKPKTPVDPLRAFLGGDDVSDGAAELRKVGRCLNWIDVDDLAQPIGVDADVDRLAKLLDVGDRRGVVLVGPSGSGKSARIEGAARIRRDHKNAATRGLIWHLSPARLISGMSYLGQWQERVLGIIKHAHRYDHILYFDEFLGLYEAGKTRDSMMCVADTLRAQLDVRPFRILTEMTSEAWAILRERDRTLADRFVVMPTEALDPDKSMEILIGVRQQLESTRRCKFDSDVLPEVVSLYDRFERSTALPGKAVAAMSRLASRSGGNDVLRHDAIKEFQSRTGLQSSIIDRRVSISRKSVTAKIRQQVVGQDKPVQQLVDRIMIAAARMNDTSRPIGTYLLVGPTGVGKTQLAKAVASCLFDENGLIRLDMNELSSPASASRLVGTFDMPDGLLTSAVRRRPNAVLLLDEIEKAHPSVLDVLLQALGEARLSDARGRTVDLSGLLILMTSNLGARASGRSSGFTDAGDAQKIEENHLKAVKEFFRPEFFNRIDDVLSFERLSADVMQLIAMMQFREILQRDGLQRRSVLIDIDPEAIRQTATRGYDPAMGARALKRQIERDLVGPAAKVLAATKSDQPTLLRLHCVDTDVHTQWVPIEYLQRSRSSQDWSIDELCTRAEDWLHSIEPSVDGGPLTFEVNGNGVDPKTLETMTLRDSLLECQTSIRQLREISERPTMQRPLSSPVETPSVAFRFEPTGRVDMRDMQAIDDIQDFLRDSLVMSSPRDTDPIREQLINQLGRLHSQLQYRGTAARWLLWTRWYGEQLEADDALSTGGFLDLSDSTTLAMAISQWASEDESLMVQKTDITTDRVVEMAGALAAASISEFCGSWMFVSTYGQLKLADVRMKAIDESKSIADQFHDWKYSAAKETVSPVRRIIQWDKPLIDLLTGAVENGQTLNKSGVQSIVRLLQQSRRSLEFLEQPHTQRTNGVKS